MARRKVVLVIVEGLSDEDALGVIFNRLLDKSEVLFHVVHGDITSDYDIEPENIASAIGDIVKGHANSLRLKKSDYQKVIHIIDMDGAFIPNSAIILNQDAETPIYSLTYIQTKNPENIMQRNIHKQEKILRICTMSKVWASIPYQVYYMSCNLDHALHGKLNSTDEEKEDDAYAFARMYKDDIDGFLTFISDSDFSKMDGYRESWKFIQQDLHSLERYTNLGIEFIDIREARKYHVK